MKYLLGHIIWNGGNKAPSDKRVLFFFVAAICVALLASVPNQVSDLDGDGLPDISESSWGTHPDMADTDLDGLLDGDEVSGFTLLLIPNRVFTDPLDPDTDNDELLDGAEVRLQQITIN